jgi:hypothetical protein
VTATANRWQFAAKVALIVFAVGLFYWPALRAGFVWDDEPLITANPLMRNRAKQNEEVRFAQCHPERSEGPHNLQYV